jgi:hypothetical protein
MGKEASNEIVAQSSVSLCNDGTVVAVVLFKRIVRSFYWAILTQQFWRHFMSYEITASFETLSEQGPMIASAYLSEAVARIDDQFGDGFAEKHPVLTGMFIVVAAIECAGATLAQQIRCGLTEAASSIGDVSFAEITDELRSLTEATASVSSAIENL